MLHALAGRLQVAAKVERLTADGDLLPTIVETGGVRMPKGVKLNGKSLLPLLHNPAADRPDRTLCFQWDGGQVPRCGSAFTVLTGRWKLVQPCGMDQSWQQPIRDTHTELCKNQGRGKRGVEGPPRNGCKNNMHGCASADMGNILKRFHYSVLLGWV